MIVYQNTNYQNLANIKADGVRMLQFLRALGTEDQRIAYAVLEGMDLQRKLDIQRNSEIPTKCEKKKLKEK